MDVHAPVGPLPIGCSCLICQSRPLRDEVHASVGPLPIGCSFVICQSRPLSVEVHAPVGPLPIGCSCLICRSRPLRDEVHASVGPQPIGCSCVICQSRPLSDEVHAPVGLAWRWACRIAFLSSSLPLLYHLCTWRHPSCITPYQRQVICTWPAWGCHSPDPAKSVNCLHCDQDASCRRTLHHNQGWKSCSACHPILPLIDSLFKQSVTTLWSMSFLTLFASPEWSNMEI